MVFEKKKIQSETLGEYLTAVRKSLNLSLKTVASKTAIKIQFLESLERGDFTLLPPDVYALGFLRQLAEVYSVDSASLAEQYKKEKLILNQLQIKRRMERSWPKKFLNKIVVTPKFLSIFLGVFFVATTIIYIVWQVVSINKQPSLEIFEPQNNQLISASILNVNGKTDPGINVSVNGNKDVFVDNDGNFQIKLALEPGIKNLEIVAQNKFGKSVTKTLAVVGEQQPLEASGQVQLRLDFSGDVSLQISVDDSVSQNFAFHSGDSKVFTGQKKVIISVSDSGKTQASLNGKNLGLLGRSGQMLSNIPFFPESGGVESSK